MAKEKAVKLLNWIVYVYILTYILPTGKIGPLPIQKICVCLFMLVGVLLLLNRRKIKSIIIESKLEIIVFGTGIIWCLISYVKGSAYSVKFAGILFVSVIVLLIMYYLIQERLLNLDMIIKCMLYMMILKIIAKIFIEISFLLGIIEYDAVFQLYEKIFRAPASMMTMNFGSIELIRVQSPSDIVVASLLPFYLIIPNEKEGIKIFNFLMLGIYTVIVFSRVYIVEFACFMFVAVVFYWKKIPKKVRYGGIGIIAISSLVWFRPMVEMLCFRFFSDNVAEADSVRTEQIRELVIGIKNAPIWGHGMGSFLPDLIRSEEIPFSYEAEYLSFIYQLGIVGFIILIVGILCIYLKRLWIYVRNNSLEVKVFSFVCIGWLLIRPAFNPSFLGLQNGFPVIGLLLLNAYFNEKSRSEI